ncbi:hypothetical protein FHU38_001730 [Saccharomonospora amisosensis]|uniref:Uncharacterized protein n=1 Tax=Saccharomonospora amisosensis TaxID=1128677 RepID=A0A7X5UNQ9_9PSEU|nr:hypothetical protein [Saccharomonospora amisosensis]NIJ11386.1 hypothetical protein [Saccharomonospora amisosensis]
MDLTPLHLTQSDLPNPKPRKGLASWLARRTPPRPLVVTTPGGTRARLAAERVVRERGWREADSPAEANLFVIAGPSTEQLRPYLDAVWRQLPAPRVRVRLDATATAELAAAADALRVAGSPEPGATSRQEEDEVGMADRFPDRDGLTLDRLLLPLGPALPHWPAGLAVRAQVQGDIVQEATVEALGLDGVTDPPLWASRSPAARALDSCARLLTVAGWADAAAQARRLRDDLLRGEPDEPALARWGRRVRRSRTLRWLLAGIGDTGDTTAPARLRGDALARLHRLVDEAMRPDQEAGGSDDSTEWSLRVLPELLRGSELAAARIIVASLDPDPEALARAGAGGG